MRLRKSSPKRARSGTGRGALMIITGLLIGSATLRMGSDAGQALARPQDPVDGAGLDSAQTPLACEMPEDFRQMLTAFQARETRLKEQETAIADRLAALQLADQEIDRKMKRLVAAEIQLSETIALADTAAESDIDRIGRVPQLQDVCQIVNGLTLLVDRSTGYGSEAFEPTRFVTRLHRCFIDTRHVDPGLADRLLGTAGGHVEGYPHRSESDRGFPVLAERDEPFLHGLEFPAIGQSDGYAGFGIP